MREQRFQLLVRGRVQGVGFRNYVAHHAVRLGCTGYVCNLTDESAVAIVAEGTDAALRQLLALVQRGSPLARVDGIDIEWSDATGEHTVFARR